MREGPTAAINDMTTRLLAGDTEGVFYDYVNLSRGDPTSNYDGWKQLFDKHQGEMLVVLQSLKNLVPEVPEDHGGNSYFYAIIDPITGKPDTFCFIRTNTGWTFDLNILTDWERKTVPAAGL
jgi:hypothetical protein